MNLDFTQLSHTLHAATLLPTGYEHCFRVRWSPAHRRCYYVEWDAEHSCTVRSFWTIPPTYDPETQGVA